MTDSIRVFDPGFRVLDQNGLLVPGALIKFYDATTTTPKTVYSDSGLATGIGSIITCDAYGAPSSGGADVLIYTGIAAYRIQIYTSAGALIPGMDFDNIRGALDTSTFGATAVVKWPVVAVSATGTTANTAKLENTNPTAGQITRTLPTAASAGNGAYIWIRHDGTANATLVASQGSDLIHMRDDLGSRQTLALWTKGDAVLLTSDGVDWHAMFSPSTNQGRVWIIKAQQTAPPGSPVAGDAYIINGAPTGGWSTFAANDIVTCDGNAGWIRSRPFAGCGWLVVQIDTGVMYRYTASSWVSEFASYAVQADQETATSITKAVTPGTQQYHPSAAKAWVGFDGTGTVAIKSSYNVSSITDNGVGDWTVNFVVPFSTAFYTPSGWVRDATNNFPYVSGSITAAPTASACRVRGCNGANAAADATHVSITFFGDF